MNINYFKFRSYRLIKVRLIKVYYNVEADEKVYNVGTTEIRIFTRRYIWEYINCTVLFEQTETKG